MEALDQSHARPDGATDSEVEAAGKMSEALEKLERARGHLVSFHQLVGEADFALDDVLELLRDTGHDELASAIDEDLLGRNVLAGRWTFQILEEFDDGYWACFREHERVLRDRLMDGRRHVYEAEMKAARRSAGRAGHDAHPASNG
jgi:hypothetical protein